jgi:hypothetical protein
LIDVLVVVGWMNRVVVPAGTEKLCQLIAECRVPAPLVVVTVVRPAAGVARTAVPWIGVMPAGCAHTGALSIAKAAAIARAVAAGRKPAAAGLATLRAGRPAGRDGSLAMVFSPAAACQVLAGLDLIPCWAYSRDLQRGAIRL